MKYNLNVPLIDSPFFKSHIKDMHMSEDLKAKCQKYYDEGYVVIDLDLSTEEIEKINTSVQSLLESQIAEIQEKHYEYSDSPRVFQGWKQSASIKTLACHPKILETLTALYGRTPFPFSTINFIKGAQQPFHSDSMHFQTMPNGWIAGCWIALEDVDKQSGTLKIIPGSHKNRHWSYQDLGIPHPDNIENGEKLCYRAYENFVENLIKERALKTKIVTIKKGQCIIWAAELLHGSIEIIDTERTRKTQAVHYSFNGCTKYFHPMFSDIENGVFAEKWCNEKNNILTIKEE